MRFGHSLQDVYNGIGIVLANREDNAEALPYLNSSIESYELVLEACKAEDKSSFFSDFSVNALDRYLLKRDAKDGAAAAELGVKPIIHGGAELNVLEAGYTQTLFYMAQVYSQKGEIEKGITYCSMTMTRQMANKTYQTKDFCVNCLNLANYFSLQKNFEQAEYLLYVA